MTEKVHLKIPSPLALGFLSGYKVTQGAMGKLLTRRDTCLPFVCRRSPLIVFFVFVLA